MTYISSKKVTYVLYTGRQLNQEATGLTRVDVDDGGGELAGDGERLGAPRTVRVDGEPPVVDAA